MADNFNFKSFLFENKLGAYSKAEQLNEEDYDTKRDLIGALGSNPTVSDVASHLGISNDEAESLMKRLGMGRYKPSNAPKGGFRQNYAKQDYEYAKEKALKKVDGEEGIPSGLVGAQITMNSIEDRRKYPRFAKIAHALSSIASKASDMNHFKNIVKKYAQKAGVEIQDEEFEQGKPLFRYWAAYEKAKQFKGR